MKYIHFSEELTLKSGGDDVKAHSVNHYNFNCLAEISLVVLLYHKSIFSAIYLWSQISQLLPHNKRCVLEAEVSFDLRRF